MNIILCGGKYAGKTTLGKMLAAQYGLAFYDTDHLLLTNFNQLSTAAAAATKPVMDISELYRILGVDRFREAEAKIIGELAITHNNTSHSIIALGGGTPLSAQIAPVLRSLGKVVYLYREQQQLWQRLQNAPSLPAYFSTMPDQDHFAEFFIARDQQYRAIADLTVDISAATAPSSLVILVQALVEHYGEQQFW